ncbi:MAG: carbohydrate kinase family protein [Flavobacteriaceae bacterium]
MAKITCFGEVLWDVFPTQKKIGGAPLNVANRLQSLNHEVTMVSAVGQDNDGNKIKDYLVNCGINTNCLQRIPDYKTGKVEIVLDEKGVASYTIEHPRAWDKIALTEANKTNTKNADAFVFGSLAARDNVSKNTLYQLLELAKFKVFDLNLRPPYYTKDLLFDLMYKANFIKFNDDELYEVSHYLGSKYHALEQNLKFVAAKTKTQQICVTKGGYGAILLYNDQLYYNSGYRVKVADTVGAGDSFLAALTSQLINGENPQKAIDFACAVGALVAQSEGANPIISQQEIEAFINPLN